MTKKRKKKQSLKMNLMSMDSLKGDNPDARVGEILSMVKQNKMVILDGRLPADEEMMLIQATMGNVEEQFPGIEVCTVEHEVTKYEEIYRKFLTAVTRKQVSKAGLTFIGPSKIVKQVKKMKQESAFEVLAEV